MNDTITHPKFTLHFGTMMADAQFGRVKEEVTRWLIDSTDDAWSRLNSGRGNVNSLDQLDWAKGWAASEIENRSSYEVAGWIDPEEGDTEPFWAPRLVHVSHAFHVVDAEGDRYTGTAKSSDDAEAIQTRLLVGEKFIRLVAPDGCDSYVNVDRIYCITYQPTRTEVPS